MPLVVAPGRDKTHYIQATAPSDGRVRVGTLWSDTTAALVKRCTSISPITFASIEGTGGAPTDASYVVLALDATLGAERVLTAGAGISLTDGGVNSTITIAAATSFSRLFLVT